jgi:hypothetical protein
VNAKTQIEGSNPPDIVGPVGIVGINSTGDLRADLSKYIAKDKAELKLDDFDPATLGMFALGGKEIAIPMGIYPSFMYVNKDIFDAAQIPLPPIDYKLWGDPSQYRNTGVNKVMDASRPSALRRDRIELKILHRNHVRKGGADLKAKSVRDAEGHRSELLPLTLDRWLTSINWEGLELGGKGKAKNHFVSS